MCGLYILEQAIHLQAGQATNLQAGQATNLQADSVQPLQTLTLYDKKDF